ncbi:MAG: ABC transporter substrate-binding protein [Actinobacteria bacterium]|nr:ABC transporter substrate-binding protein [Actinomycetota bacterium]
MLLSRRRRAALGTISVLAVGAMLAACSGGSSSSASSSADGEPSGSIQVLTWRTDLVQDGTFDTYVAAFKEKYPEVTEVKVEGITDYETEVKTRMNTSNYGDVLAIPNTVSGQQLADFFEPLGQQADLEKTYRWLADRSYDGVSYGIPVVGNVQGIVYNTKVFADAGITTSPTTPEEFLADLQAIKDNDPDVTPLYTNYKDGWPLTAWTYYRGGVSGDLDFVNELVKDDAPWSGDKDMAVIDGLLYDAVHDGLTEADPTTTNWETSKNLLGTGKIGVMLLGSWAIPQMQAAAVAAGNSAEDIGYMPFPTQVDGEFQAISAGDYNLGINVNSTNKVTARAWIDWFNNESGYSESQVGLSPLADGAVPAALQSFVDEVNLITLNPKPAGEEDLLNDIQKASELSMDTPDYRKTIIDEARAGSKTKEQIFEGLNTQWAQGIADVG